MTSCRALLCTWIICFTTTICLAADRVSVPEAAEQAKALTQLEDLFRKDLANHTPAGRAAAAAKFLRAASQTSDDAVGKYMLLKQVRDLALAGGDVDSALSATRQICDEYRVDAPKLHAETLARLASSISKPDACAALANAALAEAQKRAEAEDWEGSDRYAAMADAAATKSRWAGLTSDTHARVQALRSARQEAGQLRAAREVLTNTPDDPAANRTVGRALCLDQNNWDGGLQMLAKSDAAIKPLVSRDSAAPTTAAQRSQLADDWLSFSSAQAGAMKVLGEQRALHWYELALPGLTGLQKLQQEKHQRECQATLDAYFATRPASAAQEAARAAARRQAIDSVESKALTAENITANTAVPPSAIPYRIGQTLHLSATLSLGPGTEIRGGTIDMGGRGHVVARGAPGRPVIFRGVVFVQDLGASFAAGGAVFDQCQFQKGGTWYSYHSSNWKFAGCVLYKSRFAGLTGVDYGFDIRNCAMVSMDFPEIAAGGNHMAHLRKDGNKIVACEFVDCLIPPTVCWCAEGCNFSACKFVPGEAFDSPSPFQDVAFFTDIIGPPPQEIWDPPKRAKVDAVNSGKPFVTLALPRELPVPEIIGVERIHTSSPHLAAPDK